MPIEYTTDNLLTNGNAETGSTSGWSQSGVTVVSGGSTGSYCFAMSTDSSLSQNITPSEGQVFLKVDMTGEFLPEYEVTPDEVENSSILQGKLTYSDGTRAMINVPVKNLIFGAGE